MGNSLLKRTLPSELTQPQIELIKLNTKWRESEIREWYKHFHELFSGKYLTESDFIKYYKDLLPYRHGDCNEFFKLVFNALDKDESKFLGLYKCKDSVEILIGFTVLADGDLDERLKWMFDMYDQNHDGFIDFGELRTVVKAVLILTDKNFIQETTKVDEITQTLFTSIDKNNDSMISLDEFTRTIKHNDILKKLLCPSFISLFLNYQNK